MTDTPEADRAGLQALAAFRQDLTGASTDATDRMRHSILNGSRHQRPAGKRWIQRRPAMATATAFALAGLVGGVTLRTFDSHTGSPAGSSVSSTEQPHLSRLPDVAYVSSQTKVALGTAHQYVGKTHTVYRGGSYDTWADKRTGQYRVDIFQADGSPDSTFRTTVTGKTMTGLQINHRERQYFAFTDSADKAAGPVAVPDEPAAIRSWLDKGKLTIVAEEKVGEYDTIHLRLTGTSYAAELWLDTTSFLPIKTIADKSGKVTGHSEVSTYEWLPRTGENLSHFDLQPPAGYTESGTTPRNGATATRPAGPTVGN